MILVSLFISFVIIGAFSFGGGYAALPLIQNQIVSLHHWLSPDEFNHLITISQMTPGPIAINSATFVGLKIDGIAGAVTATLGCVLPSCIIVTLLAYFYLKYRDLSVIRTVLGTLRPAVIALIATAGLAMLIPVIFQDSALRLDAVRIEGIALFLGCLWLPRKKRCSPILVMVLAGALQAGLYALQQLV
ncbi:MAG TPA: chromate transporter [Candidatus Merdibacter merdipullorum]|nr:chromate transporter [Candidatus Merdibacter merdipullorum]